MKVETFKICKVINGNEAVLYPTVIELNGKNYLVDCGYEETFEEFTNGLSSLKIEVADLHAMLLSHDDIDHIGALTLFKNKNPGAIIYSSHIEEPSISGKIKSERLQQAENSLSTLPEQQSDWANEFINQLKSIKRIEVDRVFEDGEWIDEEIQVIFTPGHTKGHISFFIPSERIIIANDALVIEGDSFEIANPDFVLDMQRAISSIEKIRDLSPKKIICYHGGIAEENLTGKLTDLINKYSIYT